MDPLSIYTAAAGVASYMHKNFTDQQRYNQQLIDQRNNWKMQNAYNSPAAQMARLKAAGLNPNLIYQQGGALSGAGEISSPSMPEAPIYDYQSVAQMALDYRLADADINAKEANARVSNAQAKGIESENNLLDNTTIKGFSKLENYRILNDEAKQFYSHLFGMSPEQVDQQNLRWFKHATELKSLAQTNANARETLKILEHEKNIALWNSSRAYLGAALDNLNFYTESAKRGLSFDKGRVGIGQDKSYDSELDYVLQDFLRHYKEIKWQSSDFKHVLDSVNQTLSAGGNFGLSLIRTFKKGNLINKYSKKSNYGKSKN